MLVAKIQEGIAAVVQLDHVTEAEATMGYSEARTASDMEMAAGGGDASAVTVSSL
jgi:hypothetical protein